VGSKVLLVAQKFWAETKRSRRLLPQTPTANDALAHAFVSRLPSGSNKHRTRFWPCYVCGR
jgi:hypothetical protein